MTFTIISFALFILALLGIALTQKPDPTTPEEIAVASDNLRTAISEAEEAVGKFAPHSDECRALLERARYCLHFSKHSTRLVVSASMIKQKRLEGIKLANRAHELALASRKLD